MGYNVKLRISFANGGKLSVEFPSSKIKPLGGLKSGKPFVLNVAAVLDQVDQGHPASFVVKPYYRKMQGGDLHIFAVEVPSENR